MNLHNSLAGVATKVIYTEWDGAKPVVRNKTSDRLTVNTGHLAC